MRPSSSAWHYGLDDLSFVSGLTIRAGPWVRYLVSIFLYPTLVAK